MTPSLPECRKAVRSVRRSDAGREALSALRPRSGFGVFRSGLPAPLLLWLRAREQRLVWTSADSFAVLDPPATASAAGQAGLGRGDGRRADAPPFGVRVLQGLDRHWDAVLALGPATAMVGLGTLAALAAAAAPRTDDYPRLVGPVLALLAVAYVALSMTAFAAYSGYRLFRSGPAPRAEAALAEVLATQWAIGLLHCLPPDGTGTLLEACRRDAAPRAERAPQRLGRIAVPLRTVTSRAARKIVMETPGARMLSEEPPAVVLGGGPLPVPALLGRLDLNDLGVFLAGTGAVLAVLAAVLAPLEADHCAPTGCRDGQPTSYGEMLYWLVTRVISGGDPNGLGPTSWQVRLIGTLLSFFGLYVLVAIFSRIVDARIHYGKASTNELIESYNAQQAQPQEGPETADPPLIKRGAARLGAALSRWGATTANDGAGGVRPDEAARGALP